MQAVLESTATHKPQIFIGRQPIFDTELNVAGYELLFRPGNFDAGGCIDGYKATSSVINNALMEIGLDDLVGDVPAYINFTKDLINDGVAELLPANRVVLEILETVEVDQAFIESVSLLVEAGYKIALDDFVFS